jgi:hypothetical protein
MLGQSMPFFIPFYCNNKGLVYSATLIFAVLRNLVREMWMEKSGSRNLVREKWLTRKKCGFIPQIQPFSAWRKVVDQKKKIRVSRTTFLEQLFYTFL